MALFKSLKKINDKVYKESKGKTSVYVYGLLKDYFILQFQEGDRAGWTLILQGNFVLGVINWQACGVCIYTNYPQLADDLMRYRDLDMYTGQTDFTVPSEEMSSLILNIKNLVPNFAINMDNFQIH